MSPLDKILCICISEEVQPLYSNLRSYTTPSLTLQGRAMGPPTSADHPLPEAGLEGVKLVIY